VTEVVPRAVAIGPGAARVLRARGSGQLEIALGPGGYARLRESGWLLVAGPRAAIGPLSVLVAGLGPRPSQAGWQASVDDGGALVLGPHRIVLDGARVERPRRTGGARRGDEGRALAAALATCPPPPAVLEPGLAALEQGDIDSAVERLAGRGDGLTPAGDDVLAGFAGWAHVAGEPVALSRAAARRSSPIGLAYLRCAERGELPDPAAALVESIVSGDARGAALRARALQRWGASSGAMMLRGIAAGHASRRWRRR
jgi:hypothetical protein